MGYWRRNGAVSAPPGEGHGIRCGIRSGKRFQKALREAYPKRALDTVRRAVRYTLRNRSDPNRPEPIRTDPTRTDPNRPEPTRVEPGDRGGVIGDNPPGIRDMETGTAPSDALRKMLQSFPELLE